jgi:hypothetical protein
VKRSLVALVLALGMVVALGAGAGATARADEPPAAPSVDRGDDAPPEPPPPVDPSLLVERHMREPEILHEKPSGFWTSNRPAIGGAYRYRLLLLGVAIAALMAALILRVVRRHARRPA